MMRSVACSLIPELGCVDAPCSILTTRGRLSCIDESAMVRPEDRDGAVARRVLFVPKVDIEPSSLFNFMRIQNIFNVIESDFEQASQKRS